MKMGNPKLPTKLLSACNQEREIGPSKPLQHNYKISGTLVPRTSRIAINPSTIERNKIFRTGIGPSNKGEGKLIPQTPQISTSRLAQYIIY